MTTDADADTWAAEHEGRVLDERYQIETLLGAGGMGAVFRGQQLTLRKPVAIKLLRPEYAGRKVYRERFLREARAASRIGHRNVVDISDFGETENGEVFFVMELLDGEDLSQRLRRVGALPWRVARQLLRQIIRGLEAAHARDVVHRDIKPANVFLIATPEDEPDEVKLLDFGVAKVTDPTSSDAAGLTSADKIMGTAMFMAPEQALGKPADARADVYAVGCIAYQMLAGQPAYPGVNAIEILMRRLNEPPPSLRDELTHIPPSIEAFVRQAMARDPVARFQSMAQMQEALRELPTDLVDERVPSRAANESGAAQPDATATGVRRSASPNASPSAVPTEAAPRSQEHGEGTIPNPQPSTSNQRRLTEPMSAPFVAALGSGAQLPPPSAEPAPAGRSGALIALVAVLLFGAGGVGAWYVTRDDDAPAKRAAAPADDAAGPPESAPPVQPDDGTAPVAAGATTAPLADAVGSTSGGDAPPATEIDTGTAPEPAVDDGGADPPASAKTPATTTKSNPPATKKKPKKKKPPPPVANRDLAAGRNALVGKIRKGCSADAGTTLKVSFNVEPSGRTGAILVRGVSGETKICAREIVRAYDFSAAPGRVDAVSLRVEY